MELKFTQGEWIISKYAETTIESNSRTIGSCGSYYDGTEETHNENIANAKLIASSPELLKALILLRNWAIFKGIDIYSKQFIEAEKAINKATI